jgi:LDH2 family malate/lactate/ureidoglycolate dehydrogenase
MAGSAQICPPAPLQTYVEAVFNAIGADDEIAGVVAAHLIRANLSGHDSHGVIRVPQYVGEADRGALRPAARPTLVHETEVAAVVDANRGFGHFSTAFALDWALARARRGGMAAVAVRHSMHIGRLGEYTERAVAGGLIAVVTVGAAGPGLGSVVPFGGQARFLSTNPWSVGVPGRDRSMVFDGATSMVAEGKVRVARAKGTLLPPGCIVDRNGVPSRNPEDFYGGGSLLPLGGEEAGHKGFGLALASALIGALAMIDDPNPTLPGARVQAEGSVGGQAGGVFLAAIDPAAFGDAERYRGMVGDTLGAAKRVPPAPGRDEVLLPGEPETITRRQRAGGIAVPETIWQELSALAERFHVTLPEHRPAP